MMRKLLPAAVLAVTVTACGGSPAALPTSRSSSPVPDASVEQVSAQVLGTQAAHEISGQVPVVFPQMIFSGLVATRAVNVSLGSHSEGSSRTFVTPKGDFTVKYTAARATKGALIPVSPGPSATPVCVFSQVVSVGNYTVTSGTGGFAGASGYGSYSLTSVTETKNPHKGKACSASAPGKAMPAGDQVDFTASGPLKVSIR